jgi:hypothetical protein
MKRKENERFEDYKVRRHNANVKVKAYCRGRIIWRSSEEGPTNTISLALRHKENQKQLEGFFDKIDLI